VQFRKITIIGVGLLGGSIGLAAQQHRIADKVWGLVRNKTNLKKCKELRVADEFTQSLDKAVQDADLVILCTPISQMLPLVSRMLGALKSGAIITDVGSVKTGVVHDLEDLIKKAGAHFVGSHPMAGGEKAGVSAARADLFSNAVCVVTPSKNSDIEAVGKVELFWQSLGARVLKMDAAQHDLLVSRSSHLPHVVAATLAGLVLDPKSPKQQASLCATGFRDTTRIASGSPEMWRDISMANRKNISRSVDVFVAELKKFQTALKAGDAKAVENFFTTAKTRRDEWAAKATSISSE
jgi:prephenate dehydrogenase